LPTPNFQPEAGLGTADAFARERLDELGLADTRVAALHAPHPDIDWAASGCAHLSGPAPAPIAACVRGAFGAFEALAPRADLTHFNAPALLAERAALSGLEGAGRTTAGGHGRLMRASDGWLAVQLPRPDDVAALPAWLECDPGGFERSRTATTPPFDSVARILASRRMGPLVERARLLGLAVAPLPGPGTPQPPWLRRSPAPQSKATSRPAHAHPLRVLDLSTLWAGPLCGRLLAAAGADVVKVEHPGRIDGARLGSPAFFDALNGDKQSASVDPTRGEGRALLLSLIGRADIVIESARPRALAQLDIDVHALVASQPGLTWLSITGHGRTPPADERVAFGDDAAVAAGLVGRDASGDPIFCGDALADPLTGVHAALAALAGARTGGGLFDVPLVGVAHRVRTTAALEAPCEIDPAAWSPPRTATRRPARNAAPLGAHTRDVLARWGIAPSRPEAQSALRC